jgi:hypothetical protein
MKTSESISDFAAALAKAQGEMDNASLNKVNPHFKSKYADLAGIRNATIPALSKNGIAVVQTTEMEADFLFVKTRLVHVSGQWIESEYPIPLAVDKPQIMGSALTYARRYNLAAICGIAAEEDDDANAAAAQTNGSAKPTYPKANSRPMFAKLETELRKHTDLSELDMFWNGCVKDRLRLDADFQMELLFTFIEHGISIASGLAELKAFWAAVYEQMKGMPMDKQDALVGVKEAQKALMMKGLDDELRA